MPDMIDTRTGMAYYELATQRNIKTKPTRRSTKMKKRIIAAVLSSMIIVTTSLVSTSAFAKDFNDSKSGETYVSISNRTNTLYYKNPHGNFNLRIWVTTPRVFLPVSDKYTIKMYDKAGKCVWSATNQRDRTYSIGGNVTKIVLTTNGAEGQTIHWQKK